MQTSFQEAPERGLPGQIADAGIREVLSKTMESASGVAAGLVVMKGANEGGILEASGAITVADMVGFLLYDATREPGVWPEEAVCPVLRRGRIYVLPEETVVAGDPVFVRTTAGVGETKGRVRNDADGGDCIAMTGARFASGGGTSDVAIVEFDLTGVGF